MASLLKFSAGLFVSNTLTEYLQERQSGSSGEPYGFARRDRLKEIIASALIQSIVNVLVSTAISWSRPRCISNGIRSSLAASASIQVASALASTLSLKFISYPVKVLGKSCQMLPVMLASTLIDGKRSTTCQYMCSLIITLGIVLFSMGLEKAGEGGSGIYGVSLLFFSLVLDGANASAQNRIRSTHKDIDGSHLMMYTNVCKIVILLLLWISFTSFTEAPTEIDVATFARKFQIEWVLIVVTASMTQFFVFSIISIYGPTTTAMVTSIRKFVSIIISVIVFQHDVTVAQWGGIMVVFMGISMDGLHRHMARRHVDKQVGEARELARH